MCTWRWTLLLSTFLTPRNRGLTRLRLVRPLSTQNIFITLNNTLINYNTIKLIPSIKSLGLFACESDALSRLYLREIIKKLEVIACQGEKPDITFLLDISPEESIARRKNQIPDRIESEGVKFLKKVNIGFREIAKKNNWIVISAHDNRENITTKIKNTLIERFS